MATQETKQIDEIIGSRRALLLGGSALAALAITGTAKAQTAVTDNDILNFALNLEYLEANFYTLAAAGTTIDTTAGGSLGITGTGTQGTVIVKPSGVASCKVPFVTPSFAAYALETAQEERNHVKALRNALGTAAVAQPALDLYNSFLGLGTAVGVSGFDPFSSELFFLIGAYIFEDVGVSAYHGAAGLITDKTKVFPAAVGIHAVEAYHAGLIRTVLTALDAATPSAGIAALTQRISKARQTFDGSATVDDVGIGTATVTLNGTTTTATITANTDSNSIGWSRTTTQVLGIVYAGGSGKGGFFPAGLNGTIK